MNKKEQNSRALDPMRHQIAKNMSVMPGGPQNNNPMNVTDNASPPIQAKSIYGDFDQNYPQMGTSMINPMAVGPSGLQQNMPMMRGKNAQAPYGMQQQPDASGKSPMPEMMEGMRLGMNIQKGLPQGFMGYQGMPAMQIPGAVPGEMNGSSGAMLPTLDSMVPGSTPQKTGQKKKGGNK